MNTILTERNGSAYEFSETALIQRMAALREMLGPKIAIAYAVKANPFAVGFLAPLADRLEICSPGEAVICDRAGADSGKYVISGVYKTPGVIADMVSAGDSRIYTVESMTQFGLLDSLSRQAGRKLPILLRLTNDSQFGINAEEIREIIRNRSQYPLLEFIGIQFFSGTQKTSEKKLRREIAMLDAFLLSLEEETGYHAPELEYGTGFPVAYFREDSLDEEKLISAFRQMTEEMQFSCRITLELGRSIAACCGTYYTKVVDKKTNNGQNYLLVDGGMHHITYYGQFMGMKQVPVKVLGRENAQSTGSYHICGSMCSMNDILGKSIPLPETEIGDILCFPNAGAYCMTEGMSLFLSRQLPLIFLTDAAGNRKLARGPFETADLNTAQWERN